MNAAHRKPIPSVKLNLWLEEQKVPWIRFSMFVHGVVFPALLVLLSLVWDVRRVVPSPNVLSETAAIFLRPISWLPFVPAVLLAMVSMTTCCFAPPLGEKAWVRIGIAIGAILSLQFCILVMMCFHVAMIISTFIALPCWYLATGALSTFFKRQISLWQIMLLVTIAACMIPVLQLMGRTVIVIPILITLGLMLATPGLNVVAYFSVANALQCFEQSLLPVSNRHQNIGLLGLFLYWAAGWYWSIMVLAYFPNY